MSPRSRSASTLVVCLLLSWFVLPVSAQQENAEQGTNGEDRGPGNGQGAATEPPSVTMVHYGPNSGGGSLASLYPEQALALGQGEAAFTGLLKREATAKRHGGILVVAPSGRSPDQGLAGAVRSQLPEAGWMTLSIAQPVAPVAALPERVLEPGQAAAGAEGSDQAGDEGGAGEGGGGGEAGDGDVEPPDLTIQVAQGPGMLSSVRRPRAVVVLPPIPSPHSPSRAGSLPGDSGESPRVYGAGFPRP